MTKLELQLKTAFDTTLRKNGKWLTAHDVFIHLAENNDKTIASLTESEARSKISSYLANMFAQGKLQRMRQVRSLSGAGRRCNGYKSILLPHTEGEISIKEYTSNTKETNAIVITDLLDNLSIDELLNLQHVITNRVDDRVTKLKASI